MFRQLFLLSFLFVCLINCVFGNELGVAPAPSYTHIKPKNHFMPVIAKAALPHEVTEGRARAEWNNLENLLRKEPESAGTHDIDLILDDLEKKYMKEPTDASFTEQSSTVSSPSVPSKIEATLQSKLSELQDILPKQEMRLQQLKVKLGLNKPKVVAFNKDFHKEKKQKQKVADAISTLALVDKRVNSLQRLVGRLYKQLGIDRGRKLSPPELVQKALKDRAAAKVQAKKDAHDMKADEALKAGSAAATPTLLENSSEIEGENESESDSDSDSETQADADHEAEVDAETEQLIQQESEGETESEGDSELEADAEVVEDLMKDLL